MKKERMSSIQEDDAEDMDSRELKIGDLKRRLSPEKKQKRRSAVYDVVSNTRPSTASAMSHRSTGSQG